MNILVTGSNGFIGKNLILRLRENSQNHVITFTRYDDLKCLAVNVSNAQVIVHLAGEMRASPNLLMQANFDLTNEICKIISKSKSTKKIIFASSIQAKDQTQYGISKSLAENILLDLSVNNGSDVSIYRFGHVFGKWCKPFYNSVIATYCYSVSREIPLVVSDPDKLIFPMYIDDVVDHLITKINEEKVVQRSGFYEVTPSYKITLGNLAKTIIEFSHSSPAEVPRTESGLIKSLYSTYISYLPVEKFVSKLIVKCDQRGKFVEFIKTQDSGQISYFTCNPGYIRGEHYHNSKTEKFLIIQGQATFYFRNLMDENLIEINSTSENSSIIQSIPGWAHNIKNTGSSELIVLVWASETFNPDKHDTYACKVIG